MKTQNILALLLFVLVFSACEKEEIQTQEATTEANQVLTSTSQEANPDSRNFDTNNATQEQIEFERALQWTAYLTARVLKNHSNELNIEFVGSGTSVSMNTLLNPNGSYPLFDQHFRTTLFYAIHAEPDGEHEPDRPLSGGGGTGLTTSAQVQAFLDYILIHNCVELYFPNGATTAVLVYTSTAHPLNNSASNEGYKFLANPITDLNGQTINVIDVLVNDNYLESHSNIIVARPDRNSGFATTGGANQNPDCDYEQYNVDFDLFLD